MDEYSQLIISSGIDFLHYLDFEMNRKWVNAAMYLLVANRNGGNVRLFRLRANFIQMNDFPCLSTLP